MDPFRLCLALGPVAIYLLLLGAINLYRRPLLVSGARDMAALMLAVSGLMVVGPIELFLPVMAAIAFGPFVWVFLIALYVLVLILVLLLLRPRLVVYNVTLGELRPVLGELLAELEPEARWAGDSLALPRLGVQFYVEEVPAMRNVSLVAAGPRQDAQGWRRLEQALTTALYELEVPRNPRGISLVSAGALLGILLILVIARDPESVAQSLFHMLRL